MDFEELPLILCGCCKAPVVVSVSCGREPKVCCPVCGQSDTLENARREAAQHTAHRLLSSMLSGLRTKDQPELSFRFVEGGARRRADPLRL
jgi:hypothetical protein